LGDDPFKWYDNVKNFIWKYNLLTTF
jgi:hypothetical protein